jgi:hypothetical protein
MAQVLTLHLFEDDVTPEQSWELVEWCNRSGADEFNLGIVGTFPEIDELGNAFDKAVRPFLLSPAPRRMLPKYAGDDAIRDIPLWSLNAGSILVLRSVLPKGIFHCYEMGGSAWYEDLNVYREGELMLGVVSHEGEAILRISPAEQKELDALGIKVRERGKYVQYESD